MVSMLKEHGVNNYSISLHPGTQQLFAYAEIDSEEAWDSIASTAVCRRWWAAMAPLMETDAEGEIEVDDDFEVLRT